MGEETTLLGQGPFLHVDWNDAWLSELISPDAERSRERESGRVQRDDNEIENQRVVVNQKLGFWEKVEKWLVAEGEGTEKERGCVHVAASMPSRSRRKSNAPSSWDSCIALRTKGARSTWR